MAQPTAYTRSYSFTDWSANNPSSQHPGVSLDNEFEAIELTTGEIRTNLALIQRDDGALANGSVGPDQLASTLTVGLRSVGDWAAETAYVANDAVWVDYKLYRCTTAHTSSAGFATDLASGRWVEVLDLLPYAEAALVDVVVGGIVIDQEDINTRLAAKAGLSGENTFSARQRITAGTATEARDYLSLRPSDYASGKPELVIRKTATAGTWEIAVSDGAPEDDGTINVVATSLTLNGVALLTDAGLDALEVKVARARRLAFVF